MAESRQRRFASLYRATLAPLRRNLARLLGNRTDAQDLAHDAYARVYAAMDRQHVERPEAFLFTTARRLALNQIKRRQIAPVREGDASKLIEFTPADTPDAAQIVTARQEWARIESAIADLPPGCRQVLLLCKMEQRTHAEISAALGIAISTVEKQHARALRLLRAALQDEESGGRAAVQNRS